MYANYIVSLVVYIFVLSLFNSIPFYTLFYWFVFREFRVINDIGKF